MYNGASLILTSLIWVDVKDPVHISSYKVFHLSGPEIQLCGNGGVLIREAPLYNISSTLLLQILDSELFEHMHHHGDFTHFYFCYRWFLLDFKRGMKLVFSINVSPLYEFNSVYQSIHC